MPPVADVAVAIGYGFIGAAWMIVAARLLTGGINLRRLLSVKAPAGAGELSPARVQLLLATIGAASTYLAAVISTRTSGKLPEMPITWLGAIGASQSFYLLAKARHFLSLTDRSSHDPSQETP